jgi:hypothetical protein
MLGRAVRFSARRNAPRCTDMQVTSRAGNFDMSLDQIVAEQGGLLMTGKIGVWTAKITVKPEELNELLGKIRFNGELFRLGARLVFRSLTGAVRRKRPG